MAQLMYDRDRRNLEPSAEHQVQAKPWEDIEIEIELGVKRTENHDISHHSAAETKYFIDETDRCTRLSHLEAAASLAWSSCSLALSSTVDEALDRITRNTASAARKRLQRAGSSMR